MSAELVWFVGAPVTAIALTAGAVRLHRSKPALFAQQAVEDEDAPLTLAASVASYAPPPLETSEVAERLEADHTGEVVGGAGEDAGAASEPPRNVVARLVRGVNRIVRRRGEEVVDAGLDAPRPDVLSALHAEHVGAQAADGAGVHMEPYGVAESAAAVSGELDRKESVTAAPGAGRIHDNVTELFPVGSGHGIVELEPEGPEVERLIAGEEWAGAVTAREVSLTAMLEAREAARLEDERRQGEADAARHQEELERIAVAEEARVRAEARARRWFVRLDGDLDSPTIAQRMTLAGTLGIRAPWAGKLLREAFAQEEEPKVRARIVGALVAGDHLDVADPFERAFAQGGIERGAVWEALKPRYEDAPWIATLLAPLHEAMTAA